MEDLDIFVIGKYPTDGFSGSPWYSTRIDFSNQAIWHQVFISETGAITDNIVSEPPPPAILQNLDGTINSVSIRINDSANMNQALKAAANILEGAQRYEKSLLSVTDPHRVVIINGEMTSAAEKLNQLRKTEFEVVDNYYDNGGVGAALKGGGDNGNDKVSFHFDSFDGDGLVDYTSPRYSDGQGILAIIGHELGHLSSVGIQFREESFNFYQQKSLQKSVPSAYQDTNYHINNEAFAHAYSKGLAEAFGINLDGWAPIEGTNWMDPFAIYNSNLFP